MNELHPELPCSFCGEPYGEERELVIVQAGEMQIGRKSGLPGFYPNEKDPTTNWFHLDCFLSRMDFTQSEPTSLEQCALCHSSLHNTRWVFRLQIGLIDLNRLTFEPYQNDKNLALLCTDCALDGFGEGDFEEGELLLGVGT